MNESIKTRIICWQILAGVVDKLYLDLKFQNTGCTEGQEAFRMLTVIASFQVRLCCMS